MSYEKLKDGSVVQWVDRLRSCSSLSHARQIHAELLGIHSNLHSDTYLSNLVVQMYGRCGSPENARKVFDAIRRKDVFSWNLLLSANARNGQLDEVKRLFELIPCKDSVSWNTLLTALVKEERLDEAVMFLDRMEHSERDPVSWNVIITGYAHSGQIDKAKDVFDAMPVWNLSSWNAMLSAFAQNCEYEEAIHLFGSMPARDLTSWSAMLTAVAESSHLQDAKVFFCLIPEWNTITCTAVLTCYARHNQLDQAKCVFDSMPVRDFISWNAMLSAYTQSGHFVLALELFDSMPERNSVSWTTILAGCGQCNRVLEAERIFSAIHCRENADIICWNAMLGVYARQSANFEQAKMVFETMPCRNLVSFITIICIYAQNGRDEDEIAAVMNRMPQLDVVSSTAVLHAYAQRGHIDRAMAVFQSMREWNVVACNAMLNGFAQLGRIEEAKAVLDSYMILHDVGSWNAMLVAYVRDGHLEEFERFFTAMPHRDATSWSVFISSISGNGCAAAARRIFERIDREQDLALWNTMLGITAQDSTIEELNSTAEIFREMVIEGSNSPDEISFTWILLKCGHAGDLEEGYAWFCSMIMDYGVRASKQHYGCVIDLLGRAGRVDDAEDLLASMPFKPQAHEWTSFLGACRKNLYRKPVHAAARKVCVMEPGNAAPYILLNG